MSIDSSIKTAYSGIPVFKSDDMDFEEPQGCCSRVTKFIKSWCGGRGQSFEVHPWTGALTGAIGTLQGQVIDLSKKRVEIDKAIAETNARIKSLQRVIHLPKAFQEKHPFVKQIASGEQITLPRKQLEEIQEAAFNRAFQMLQDKRDRESGRSSLTAPSQMGLRHRPPAAQMSAPTRAPSIRYLDDDE